MRVKQHELSRGTRTGVGKGREIKSAGERYNSYEPIAALLIVSHVRRREEKTRRETKISILITDMSRRAKRSAPLRPIGTLMDVRLHPTRKNACGRSPRKEEMEGRGKEEVATAIACEARESQS